MPNSDLLPTLLFKLTKTNSPLKQRGSAEVAGNVRGALVAIDRNEEFIKMTLALMMTPE